MIKIEKLKHKDTGIFRKLQLTIFDEGFSYYPGEAQEFNKKYWSEERLLDLISKKDRLFLIAKEGAKPVGYLIGKYYVSGTTSIRWLGVLEDFRRRGIGKGLVKGFERWSMEKGAKKMKATTANFDNDKFYTMIGFSKLKVNKKNDWGMVKHAFVRDI